MDSERRSKEVGISGQKTRDTVINTVSSESRIHSILTPQTTQQIKNKIIERKSEDFLAKRQKEKRSLSVEWTQKDHTDFMSKLESEWNHVLLPFQGQRTESTVDWTKMYGTEMVGTRKADLLALDFNPRHEKESEEFPWRYVVDFPSYSKKQRVQNTLTTVTLENTVIGNEFRTIIYPQLSDTVTQLHMNWFWKNGDIFQKRVLTKIINSLSTNTNCVLVENDREVTVLQKMYQHTYPILDREGMNIEKVYRIPKGMPCFFFSKTEQQKLTLYRFIEITMTAFSYTDNVLLTKTGEELSVSVEKFTLSSRQKMELMGVLKETNMLNLMLKQVFETWERNILLIDSTSLLQWSDVERNLVPIKTLRETIRLLRKCHTTEKGTATVIELARTTFSIYRKIWFPARIHREEKPVGTYFPDRENSPNTEKVKTGEN